MVESEPLKYAVILQLLKAIETVWTCCQCQRNVSTRSWNRETFHPAPRIDFREDDSDDPSSLQEIVMKRSIYGHSVPSNRYRYASGVTSSKKRLNPIPA